jgi:hypothetical protein
VELVIVPPPPKPSLSVKVLARLLGMHPWEWTTELRDHKFPRSPGARGREHYYQPVIVALRGLVESGGDVRVLAHAVRTVEEKLAAGESSGDITGQLATKLGHNLRVLGHLPSFARVRDAGATLAVKARKVRVSDVEIRSTPDLIVRVGASTKYVFLHLRDEPCEEEEVRRMLDLAHWVEVESGNAASVFADFEYWVLSENRVLRWKTARKTTVSRAKQSLPILIGAWDKVEPPKAWKPAEAASESEG